MTTDIKPTLPSDSQNNNDFKNNGERRTRLLTADELAANPDLANADLSETPLRTNGRGQDMAYRGIRYASNGSGRYAPEKLVLSRRGRQPLLQWFYNLPVRNKQLIGLISSEVISVLGLVGVGSLLIISGGRLQLVQQSRAELAVANIQYQIKINQMGFGFRGQSDNVAIVEAAETHDSGYDLAAYQLEQVQGILRNEISARQIEYATLVGKDGTIIASANADRVGEPFDPEGLVSRVLRTPQQVKTSAIIPWEDLQAEDPPLPNGFQNEDALIRYTATPVFSQSSEQGVVGVLISGDIVNGKLPIVAETVSAFDSGYSAVYLQGLSGDWILATSADRDPGEEDLETFEPIYDTSLLDNALAAEGKIVTQRVLESEGEDAGNSYTMAAQAISDIDGKPIGVLIRGTSEDKLNQLIGNSLKLQFLVAAIALLVDIFLAQLLGRSIVSPLKRLRQTTEDFARGDRRVRADVFARDEVGQLATAFNELASTVSQSESSLVAQSDTQTRSAQRSRLLADITSRIRQSLEFEQIFAVSVDSLRDFYKADRVVIYKFNPGYESGVIAAESVARGWLRIKDQVIEDPLTPDHIEHFKSGRTTSLDDLDNAELTQCHCDILNKLEVKANLVTSIFIGQELYGLLALHQCSGPRKWLPDDIELFEQISIQLGYALAQAESLTAVTAARNEAESLSEERRQRQEALQMQLLGLLEDVEGAAQGDLTVRADVTAGEIGTVADFFNSIVESLRQIVTQVKASATQVNTSLGSNEAAIQALAEDSLQQAEQTTQTLTSVEEITQAINRVADQAQQAAQVAKTASETAEAGGVAMDLTVQNIMDLRQTVGETAKKVKRLGESSQQISKVVSLINQIAMQTNLLAINAGIEAARAGEDGQGFAAVAEEVGELAARSAAATQEIERIVDIIQRETTDVVEAIEDSTAQVVEGTHRVEDAKQSLTQMLEVSRQIDGLAQTISEATVAQVETATTVSTLMQEIAAVSERTSASSVEVSDALRETVAVAQELETSMAAFKVDSQG